MERNDGMTAVDEMFVTHRYAQEVVDGLRPCCKMEYLACQRHLRDLERQGTEEFPYVFDETRADRIFDWFEHYCCHVRGVFAGQPIQLLPFQYFDLGCIFGWVQMETGKRRFTTAFNFRARGNVKSTEMSGVALYGMCADAIYPPYHPELRKFEDMPEVECAAVDRMQARRVWGDAQKMGEKSEKIRRCLDIRKTYITHKTRGGWLRPLSKDTKNKDSGAPCIVIVDEYHAHQSSDIVEILKSGFGKRYQSLLVIISTAGKDAENNPCKKEYDMARSVLMGELVDDSYFAMIREVEQGDDVSSPACWVKANPILQSETEYSINLLSEIQTEYNRAYGSGDADKIREFLTKRCNIWQQDSEEKFLTSEQLKIWDELAVPQEEFKKLIKGREHLAGYDLSKKIDLTAYAGACNLPDGRVAVWAHGFIPGDAVEQHAKKDRVPYFAWIENGWVTETDGAVVDYNEITRYVDEFCAEQGQKPKEDCFDPYNATFYMTELGQRSGRTPVEVRQTVYYLSEPTNWLRELIVSRKLVHDGNPLLKWALANAYAYVDGNGNIKLSKKNKDDTQRIDPAAALVNALSRLPKAPKKRSKYEDTDFGEL